MLIETYHVILGVQFREVVLGDPGLDCRIGGRVRRAVVVPEEETGRVGLVNVVVEIPTTRHW